MQFGKTKNIFIAAAGISITDNLLVYFQVGYYCCSKKYQVAFARGDIAFRHLDAQELIRCYTEAYRIKLDEPVEVGELNDGQPSMLKTVYGFYGRLRDMDKVYGFMADQDLDSQLGPSSAYVTVSLAESLYERNQLKESYAVMTIQASKAGIHAPGGSNLFIDSLSGNDDEDILTVSSGNHCAGIGGYLGENGGNITISGGTCVFN